MQTNELMKRARDITIQFPEGDVGDKPTMPFDVEVFYYLYSKSAIGGEPPDELPARAESNLDDKAVPSVLDLYSAYISAVGEVYADEVVEDPQPYFDAATTLLRAPDACLSDVRRAFEAVVREDAAEDSGYGSLTGESEEVLDAIGEVKYEVSEVVRDYDSMEDRLESVVEDA